LITERERPARRRWRCIHKRSRQPDKTINETEFDSDLLKFVAISSERQNSLEGEYPCLSAACGTQDMLKLWQQRGTLDPRYA
jgi:hypothetical protein